MPQKKKPELVLDDTLRKMVRSRVAETLTVAELEIDTAAQNDLSDMILATHGPVLVQLLDAAIVLALNLAVDEEDGDGDDASGEDEPEETATTFTRPKLRFT